MKIAINAGHTKSGAGSGAVGCINESTETRKVVAALIPLLQKQGHTVINATVDTAATQQAYLQQTVKIANQSKADLFISIHFNAGGGTGCECYTYKKQNVKQAQNVNAQLQKLGFRNRGIKDGTSFYVVKYTTMPAVLLEVCFVDNCKDMQLYKQLGAAKIAQAIAAGIAAK
jgi:N-acetylmuramoyl-L-alanine amidase